MRELDKALLGKAKCVCRRICAVLLDVSIVMISRYRGDVCMGRRGLGLYMGMESILYLFLARSCPWTVWYVLAESVVYGMNHAILRQANHFRNGT
jgi:hypothetical protein